MRGFRTSYAGHPQSIPEADGEGGAEVILTETIESLTRHLALLEALWQPARRTGPSGLNVEVVEFADADNANLVHSETLNLE